MEAQSVRYPRTMMKAMHTALGAALSFAVVVPGVLAQEERAPPPKYQFLRQNEDWSSFRAKEGDWLARFKHLDLTDDGSVWLSMGGRVEARFESWDGFGFGAQPSNQDSFTVSRALVHADVHFGDRARFFVEGKTAQATDRNLPGGRRASDMDTLEAQQVFADYMVPLGDGQTLRVRAGRMMLLYGKQRLVSPLPWANVLRSWDGVSVQLRTGRWTIDGFATQFVPVRKTSRNKRDDDLELYGVYATRKPADGGYGYDVFFLGNTRPSLTINGTTGKERRHTIGARTWGPLGDNFDGEFEGAYQFGEVGSNSVTAWTVTGVLGHTVADWKWSPRFFVGVDAASGDSRAGGSVGTFHQIFPLGHAYLGWADIIARQNVFAVHVGGTWKLSKTTTAKLVGHAFRLQSGNDALYGVSGAVSRTGLGSKDVAQEVDLLVSHHVCEHLDVYGGYSHVFGGGGLAASGPSGDISFFYLGSSFVF
ncbi:MAG: hypothetical protein ACJAYX_003286 [Planctomycetota bacterium]|jgi:hypothetical protein